MRLKCFTITLLLSSTALKLSAAGLGELARMERARAAAIQSKLDTTVLERDTAVTAHAAANAVITDASAHLKGVLTPGKHGLPLTDQAQAVVAHLHDVRTALSLKSAEKRDAVTRVETALSLKETEIDVLQKGLQEATDALDSVLPTLNITVEGNLKAKIQALAAHAGRPTAGAAAIDLTPIETSIDRLLTKWELKTLPTTLAEKLTILQKLSTERQTALQAAEAEVVSLRREVAETAKKVAAGEDIIRATRTAVDPFVSPTGRTLSEQVAQLGSMYEDARLRSTVKSKALKTAAERSAKKTEELAAALKQKEEMQAMIARLEMQLTAANTRATKAEEATKATGIEAASKLTTLHGKLESITQNLVSVQKDADQAAAAAVKAKQEALEAKEEERQAKAALEAAKLRSAEKTAHITKIEAGTVALKQRLGEMKRIHKTALSELTESYAKDLAEKDRKYTAQIAKLEAEWTSKERAAIQRCETAILNLQVAKDAEIQAKQEELDKLQADHAAVLANLESEQARTLDAARRGAEASLQFQIMDLQEAKEREITALRKRQEIELSAMRAEHTAAIEHSRVEAKSAHDALMKEHERVQASAKAMYAQEAAKLQTQITELNERLTSARRGRAEAVVRLSSAKKKTARADAKVEALQAQLVESKANALAMEGTLATLRQEMEVAYGREHVARTQLQEAQALVEKANLETEALRQQLRRMEASIEADKAKIESATAETATVRKDTEETIASLSAQLSDAEGRKDAAERAVVEARRALEDCNAQLKIAEGETAKATQAAAQANVKAEKLAAQLMRADAELGALRQQIADMQEAHTNAIRELETSHEKALSAAKSNHQETTATLMQEYKANLEDLTTDYNTKKAALEGDAKQAMALAALRQHHLDLKHKAITSHEAKLEKLKVEHANAIAGLKIEYGRQQAAVIAEAEAKQALMQGQLEEMTVKLSAELDAREKAQKRFSILFLRMNLLKSKHQRALAEERSKHVKALEEMQFDYESTIAKMVADQKEASARRQKQQKEELEKIVLEFKTSEVRAVEMERQKAERQHEINLADLRLEHAQKVSQIEADALKAQSKLQTDYAQKIKALQEEYTAQETTLLMEMGSLKAELSAEKQAHAAADEKIGTLTAEIDKLNQALAAQTEELSMYQRALAREKENAADLMEKLKAGEKTLIESNTTIKAKAEEIAALMQSLEAEKAAHSLAVAAVAEKEALLKEKAVALEESGATLAANAEGISALQKAVEAAKAEHAEAARTIASQEAALKVKIAELEELHRKNNTQGKLIEQMTIELHAKQENIVSTNAQLRARELLIQDLEEQLRGSDAALEQYKSLLIVADAKAAELSPLRRSLETAKQEHALQVQQLTAASDKARDEAMAKHEVAITEIRAKCNADLNALQITHAEQEKKFLELIAEGKASSEKFIEMVEEHQRVIEKHNQRRVKELAAAEAQKKEEIDRLNADYEAKINEIAATNKGLQAKVEALEAVEAKYIAFKTAVPAEMEKAKKAAQQELQAFFEEERAALEARLVEAEASAKDKEKAIDDLKAKHGVALQVLEDQLQAASEQLAEKVAALNAALKEATNTEGVVGILRGEVASLTSDLTKHVAIIVEQGATIAAQVNELAFKDTEIQNLRTALNAAAERARAEAEHFDRAQKGLKERYANETAELNRQHARHLDEAKKAYEAQEASLREDMDNLKEDARKASATIASLQSIISKLEVEVKTNAELMPRLSALQQQLSEKLALVERYESELAAKDQEKAELIESYSLAITKQEEKHRNALQSLEAENANVVRGLEESLEAAKAEYRANLDALEARYVAKKKELQEQLNSMTKTAGEQREKYKKLLKNLRAEHDAEMRRLRRDYDAEMDGLRQDNERLKQEASKVSPLQRSAGRLKGALEETTMKLKECERRLAAELKGKGSPVGRDLAAAFEAAAGDTPRSAETSFAGSESICDYEGDSDGEFSDNSDGPVDVLEGMMQIQQRYSVTPGMYKTAVAATSVAPVSAGSKGPISPVGVMIEAQQGYKAAPSKLTTAPATPVRDGDDEVSDGGFSDGSKGPISPVGVMIEAQQGYKAAPSKLTTAPATPVRDGDDEVSDGGFSDDSDGPPDVLGGMRKTAAPTMGDGVLKGVQRPLGVTPAKGTYMTHITNKGSPSENVPPLMREYR